MTRSGCQNDLIHNCLSFSRVFFEIVFQGSRYCLWNSGTDFCIPQFRFSLTFKLWFCHFHRNHSRQSFAEIIAIDIEFQFWKHSVTLGISFQGRRQSPFETGQVSTPFYRIDIIDIRKYILWKTRIIMQSDLHRDSILFCRYIDRIFDQFFPGIIEVFDKFTQTVLRKEHFMPGSIGLRIDLPFIGQR